MTKTGGQCPVCGISQREWMKAGHDEECVFRDQQPAGDYDTERGVAWSKRLGSPVLGVEFPSESKHTEGCWNEGESFEEGHLCSTELTLEDLHPQKDQA